MISITLRLHGADTVALQLGAASKRAADLTPAFAQIDKTVSTMFQRQFASSGAFGGQPWAPLRASTLADKARINRAGMGTLRRFNTLWRSLVAPGSPQGIRVIDKQRYERGTAVPYAVHHQYGYTVRKWGRVNFKRPIRVPARPLWPDPLPQHLVNTWVRVLRQHISAPFH